jgi:type 1 glutamine amidotransferase
MFTTAEISAFGATLSFWRSKMKPVLRLFALTAFAAALFVRPAHCAEVKADTVLRIEKALPDAATVKPEKARKVLVYTRASGFVHSSIPVGAKAFELLGKKTGAFEVTKITEDPAIFDTDLNEYDAIVLMSCTGDFMRPSGPSMPKKEELAKKSDEEKKKLEDAMKAYHEAEKAFKEAEPARQKALLNFVASGKGLIGIHAATDAYYKWTEYGEMIGGYFNGHPWHNINIKVDDSTSPVNAVFEGKNFDFNDEIYTYKTLPTHSREKLHVLLSVDLEASSKLAKPDIKKDAAGKYSGENRADHDYAVAWIKKYGNGRVFYTLLGHNEGTFQNPTIMKFFLAGAQYALGDVKADDSPSVKTAATSTTPSAPSSPTTK